MKVLVDILLDSGQRLQSRIFNEKNRKLLLASSDCARDMVQRQMVRGADILDVKTGEVLVVFTMKTLRDWGRARDLGRELPGLGGVFPA